MRGRSAPGLAGHEAAVVLLRRRAVMVLVFVGTFDGPSIEPATLRRETTVMVLTVAVVVVTGNH
ncbi:hypothetical protein [Streptomyces sp. ODS28]|uniref:hypothetical protein n=1 Tax=Streptomyces sp. ODS28 TaxID=3136688 RepID=UPI0031E6EA27